MNADPSDPIPLPNGSTVVAVVPCAASGKNQAGPRDSYLDAPSTGFPLGGSDLFFNSTEVRFPLYGANIRGVLFEDFGNVFFHPRKDVFPH